jgi:hypothetical protein
MHRLVVETRNMLTRHSDIASILSRTLLAGADLLEFPIPADDDVVFYLLCHDMEPIEAWRAAREVQDVTGRYPTITTDYGGPGSFVTSGYHPDKARPIADTLRESEAVDVRSMFERLSRRWPTPLVSTKSCEHVIKETLMAVGAAPPLDEVVAGLVPGADDDDLEWWMLQWEIRHAESRAMEYAQSLGEQSLLLDPGYGNQVLCFWPTEVSWHLGAYVPYFGADQEEAAWCATLRDWEQRYATQMVGIDGVMVALNVGVQPTTLREAWDLSADLIAWGGNHEGDRRHFTLSLLDSQQWSLFSRP